MSIKPTTNENVAIAWTRGREAQNHSGAYSTNGSSLYSYSTRIGFTTGEGTKVLLDYTAKTGNFLSMTTSTKHVSKARQVADLVVNPSVVQHLEKFEYGFGCQSLSSIT
jgi:hypothetical protein